jgi:hypothetical protein
MNEPVDWTDETLRPLDALARLAFPDGGVTAETLRRRGREGALAVYRPGKAYLASLSGVRAMIEKTRVLRAREPSAPRATPRAPNSLGPTEWLWRTWRSTRCWKSQSDRPKKPNSFAMRSEPERRLRTA